MTTTNRATRILEAVVVLLTLGAVSASTAAIGSMERRQDLWAIYFLLLGALSLRAIGRIGRPVD